MSFGASVKNFFSPIWQHIETAFPASVQFVINFFQYVIQYVLLNGGFILTEAAEAAVKDAANTSLTNAEKFTQAYNDIWAIVSKNGLKVGETAIKLALYSALAKYKVIAGETTTAPATVIASQIAGPSDTGAPVAPVAAQPAPGTTVNLTA